MSAPRRRRSRAAGFTLLEVLIAFVIMALAVGVLLRGIGISLHATQVAGMYAEGLSRAQSHLEAITAPGVGISTRAEEGDEGNGYHWRIEIMPVATATAVRQRSLDGGGPRLSLYAARVVVSWSGATRGSVTLATELLGPAPS